MSGGIIIKDSNQRNVSFPLGFVRRSKLTPNQFRILVHGLTYPTGWNLKKCALECGLSLYVVKKTVSELEELGYMMTVPHHLTKKYVGKRFRIVANKTDEERIWYDKMMELNDGDLKGLVFDKEQKPRRRKGKYV